MHHFQEMLFLLPLDRIFDYVRATTPYVQYIFWVVVIIRGFLEGIDFMRRKLEKKSKP